MTVGHMRSPDVLMQSAVTTGGRHRVKTVSW